MRISSLTWITRAFSVLFRSLGPFLIFLLSQQLRFFGDILPLSLFQFSQSIGQGFLLSFQGLQLLNRSVCYCWSCLGHDHYKFGFLFRLFFSVLIYYAIFCSSRISFYVSSFQSIFTAEGVFHRETAKVSSVLTTETIVILPLFLLSLDIWFCTEKVGDLIADIFALGGKVFYGIPSCVVLCCIALCCLV